ncbi:activating signal cointegrator 1 complex subunit 1 isoform X2 [Rhipicephalus microplus]|uniref:activating signal cointegrator 1 complex subunit 1 isoform X2 n=1 Tax=Rhipicephalus microplus TaxID=6941 RepID=UPI003F6BE660
MTSPLAWRPRRKLFLCQMTTARMEGRKDTSDEHTTCRIDFFLITGQTEEDVESAQLRISAIVRSMRQREHFTHFVCFPLNNPKLANTLEEFKEIVEKSCTARGLDKSLFVSKQKLHLTIGMLVLLDAKECSMAQGVLEDCKDLVKKILEDEPLMVRVHGLEIMNDDESEVDVLYAKVSSWSNEGSSRSPEKCRLQQLADAVAQRFLDSGFMLRQQERGHGPEHVKLHMTIMNTRLREQRFAIENTSLPPTRKPRNSFDARTIMKRNRDFSFGRAHIPSITVVDPHNCEKDGFYKKIAELALPKPLQLQQQ